MRQLDEDELRRMAREVNYEVTTLVGQVAALHSGIFVHGTPVYMALVEAPLVHLRLLDEFCWRSEPSRWGDDVYAQLFLDSWEPCGFLERTTVDDINAQLQHLPDRRRNGYLWNFGDLIERCSFELLDFFSQHAAEHDDRSTWFAPSVEALTWASVERPDWGRETGS